MWKRLVLISLAATGAAAAQDGWISLFNGKDFTGWKISEKDTGTFTIQDGAIQAHGPRTHCYYMGPVQDHVFKNFELKVDVMTLPGSNGGIYFHTEYLDTGWPAKGFEVQVNNSHTDPVKSGSLYHVKDIFADTIQRAGVRDGEWFTELIVVHDKTVTISLNGTQVVQWTQPDGWVGSKESAGRYLDQGTIALQGHDPNSTVRYKNIQIKPLP